MSSTTGPWSQLGLRHCHKKQTEITEAWLLHCKTAWIANKSLDRSVSWHTNYTVGMLCFHKSLYGLKVYSKISHLVIMSAFGKGAGVHCNANEVYATLYLQQDQGDFQHTSGCLMNWSFLGMLPSLHMWARITEWKEPNLGRREVRTLVPLNPSWERGFPIAFQGCLPPSLVCMGCLTHIHAWNCQSAAQQYTTPCSLQKDKTTHFWEGQPSLPLMHRFLRWCINFLVNIVVSNWHHLKVQHPPDVPPSHVKL